MLNVICVLKSGGEYDVSYVERLKAGVEKHLSLDHRFRCLSDVPVPGRIPLKHDWPAWWSKIELFRKRVITEPTLYLDLDTIITGPIGGWFDDPRDFAMLRNFHNPNMLASGVMWFRKPPTVVYDKFVQKPWQYIEYYQQFIKGNYVGDQAFIYDTLRNVDFIEMSGIRSYKKHCRESLPEDTRIVCFHGLPRPHQVRVEWMKEHWNPGEHHR